MLLISGLTSILRHAFGAKLANNPPDSVRLSRPCKSGAKTNTEGKLTEKMVKPQGGEMKFSLIILPPPRDPKHFHNLKDQLHLSTNCVLSLKLTVQNIQNVKEMVKRNAYIIY